MVALDVTILLVEEVNAILSDSFYWVLLKGKVGSVAAPCFYVAYHLPIGKPNAIGNQSSSLLWRGRMSQLLA